ncbi:Rv3235 family protein [Arthrobacter sp. CAL618]|uniref:Rv3235 family protein n=1 Tax=Arthrobacter sp. CAL618 TaxID=1055770 RepID=UPI00042037C4|nr:Rv3235 family protein [Arthrobacter sp. CAL618]
MLTQTQIVRPPLAPDPTSDSLTGSGPDRQVSAPTPTIEELAAATQVQRITRSVVQASLEVLGGSRPLQQLAEWLDPPSYERLQLRANLVRSLNRGASTGRPDHLLHRNISVRSVRICRITETVYEASAVACENHRARAVALRLERRRGHWRVTALEIG